MNSNTTWFAIMIGIIIMVQIGWAEKKEFLWLGTFICEGEDSGNYTNVVRQQSDADCSQDSIQTLSDVFIKNGPNGKEDIISTQRLASARHPLEAEVIAEKLILFTSGPLAGKYGLVRNRHLLRDYLKKCSSVLGLSFITTVKSQLMISDSLELNVMNSPTGAYEAFKKSSTTVCEGSSNGPHFGV